MDEVSPKIDVLASHKVDCFTVSSPPSTVSWMPAAEGDSPPGVVAAGVVVAAGAAGAALVVAAAGAGGTAPVVAEANAPAANPPDAD